MVINHFTKFSEKVIGVMRSWRCFRVVLNGENGLGTMTETLARLVVEVDLGGFCFRGRQGLGINGKAVVLRGNTDFTRRQVFYRLIAATMTEFEFEGLSPQRIALRIWWPRQMPKMGFLPISDWTVLWA